jgi:hypothetical protein
MWIAVQVPLRVTKPSTTHTHLRHRAVSRHENSCRKNSGAQRLPSRPKFPEIRETPKCGKIVKLFPLGTKVFSLIPNHFHPYTLKEFWPVFSPHLVF